ncbi:MAG: DUF4388 domain-containing protein [bacterium]|nr:DUF4388 domain-containing protein [bacterium]
MSGGFQFHFSTVGQIGEGDIYPILYHLYKESISGILVVETGTGEKRLVIENGKIVFASSNRKEDAFGHFLLEQGLIDDKIYNKTSQYMTTHNKRFGRALIELGYFHYDQIWTWVPNHLKRIVNSFFNIHSAGYRVLTQPLEDVENIILDLDILSVLVEGIRKFEAKPFLEDKFKNVRRLFVRNSRMISQLDLKPYEIHVFDLVKREPELEKILHWSELLEFDTLRLLYLFLVMEIISTRRTVEKPDTLPEMDYKPRLSTFTSFDEALRYYNLKYELIYKVMLKEIGPISHSLLLKAVEDIMENLPGYFQKVQFRSDGSIDEEMFLKNVWYHDFDEHIGEFLRGLEEILYTKIYAVKKHLGVEYEQQVLKWINGIGN